jgi:RNA polymerase sigma-70 factor (ECF subfamily)
MASERIRVEPLSDTTGDELSPDEWQRLADGCRRRDHASFERLVRLTEDRLRRIIGRVVGARPVDIDELLQETFLRAWRGASRFRGDSHVVTWLTRIGVNVAINAARDRRATIPISVREHARSAPSELNEAAAHRAYEQALSRLPDDLRVTFVLHEAEGLTYRQVAETLDCPIGTVMSRLHRAREQLMNELREQIEEFMP